MLPMVVPAETCWFWQRLHFQVSIDTEVVSMFNQYCFAPPLTKMLLTTPGNTHLALVPFGTTTLFRYFQ